MRYPRGFFLRISDFAMAFIESTMPFIAPVPRKDHSNFVYKSQGF